MGCDDYKFLENIAKSKNVDLEEMKSKMDLSGSPFLTGVAVRYSRLLWNSV